MNGNQISDSEFKQFTRSLFNSFIQKLSPFTHLNTGNFTALYFIEYAIVDLLKSRTDDFGKTIAIFTYNINTMNNLPRTKIHSRRPFQEASKGTFTMPESRITKVVWKRLYSRTMFR